MSGNQPVLIPAGGSFDWLSVRRLYDQPPVKLSGFWAKPQFLEMWKSYYPRGLAQQIEALERSLTGLLELQRLYPPHHRQPAELAASIEMAQREFLRLQARHFLMLHGHAESIYRKLETFEGFSEQQ